MLNIPMYFGTFSITPPKLTKSQMLRNTQFSIPISYILRILQPLIASLSVSISMNFIVFGICMKFNILKAVLLPTHLLR